jgi:PAS domain S-box-containing protein
VAELEQQNRALRFAAEQSDLEKQQFSDLYDYAPVGYVTVDEKGLIHRANLTAAALLGETRQGLVGARLVSFVKADGKGACATFLQAAFQATGPTSCDVALPRGKWRAEHVQLIAAPAASGHDLGHAGAQARIAILDATARWKMEQELRASQHRFESVVSAMAEGVVVLDASGVVQTTNTAAQRILGMSADEMRGRASVHPGWRVVHEDGSPFPVEEFPAEAVLRTGVPRWNVLMGIQRPEDSTVWLRIDAEPLRNGDGSLQGAVVTFADVTEDQRRIDELRRNQERLARVLEAGSDGYWEWDVPTGRIWMSKQLSAILGGPAVEGEGYAWTWPDRVDPEQRVQVEEVLEAVAAGEMEQVDVQFRVRVSGGAWKWLRARGRVVERGANGEPVRLDGTVADFTASRVRSSAAPPSGVLREGTPVKA